MTLTHPTIAGVRSRLPPPLPHSSHRTRRPAGAMNSRHAAASYLMQAVGITIAGLALIAHPNWWATAAGSATGALIVTLAAGGRRLRRLRARWLTISDPTTALRGEDRGNALRLAGRTRDARRLADEVSGECAQPAEEEAAPTSDPDEPAAVIELARFGEANQVSEQQIRRGGDPISVEQLTGLLDDMGELGLPVGTSPAVRRARKHAGAVAKLRQAKVNMTPADRTEATEQTGQRLTGGALHLAEAPRVPVDIDPGIDHSTGRKIVDLAITVRSEACYNELRSVGDAWITKYLRPAIKATMRELAAHDEFIPANSGVRDTTPPSDPVAGTHWFAAEDCTSRLDALWDIGSRLLTDGFVPTSGVSPVAHEILTSGTRQRSSTASGSRPATFPCSWTRIASGT